MIVRLNRQPSSRELRQFGILIFSFAFVVSSVLWFKHRSSLSLAVGGTGAVLATLSLISEGAARIIYRVWMGWATVVGTIVSYFVIGLIYFLILTPVGLVFRFMGRDVLHKRRKSLESSYWVKLKPLERTSYDHLF